MKSVESKLIQFLAAPELSDADFERLTRLFHSSKVSRCLSAAAELRDKTRSAADHIKRSHLEVMRHFERRLDPKFFKDLSQVLQGLKLGPAEAMRQLASELGVEVDSPQPRSLRSGITQLLDTTDMDAIWSAAQRLRAKAETGSNKNPWPLSGAKPANANL